METATIHAVRGSTRHASPRIHAQRCCATGCLVVQTAYTNRATVVQLGCRKRADTHIRITTHPATHRRALKDNAATGTEWRRHVDPSRTPRAQRAALEARFPTAPLPYSAPSLHVTAPSAALVARQERGGGARENDQLGRRLRGRGRSYSSSRLIKVRRETPRSRAARVWLPPHRSSASRMRSRSETRARGGAVAKGGSRIVYAVSLRGGAEKEACPTMGTWVSAPLGARKG